MDPPVNKKKRKLQSMRKTFKEKLKRDSEGVKKHKTGRPTPKKAYESGVFLELMAMAADDSIPNTQSPVSKPLTPPPSSPPPKRTHPQSQAVRKKVLSLLTSLAQGSKSAAKSLEQGIFDATGVDVFQYRMRYMTLKSNLSQNPDFLEFLLRTEPYLDKRQLYIVARDFTSDDFCSLSRENTQRLEESKAMARQMSNASNLSLQESMGSSIQGLYVCAKCNGDRVRVHEQQLRSADEPMTQFIACANRQCGNRWTI